MNTQNAIKQLSRSARAARKKKEEYEKLRNDHIETCKTIKTLTMHKSAFEELKQTQTTMSLTLTTVDKDGYQWTSLRDEQREEIEECMHEPNQRVFYMKNSMEYLPIDVDLKVTIKTGSNPEEILDGLYQIMQSVFQEKHLIESNRVAPSYLIYNPNGSNWRYVYGPQVHRIEE